VVFTNVENLYTVVFLYTSKGKKPLADPNYETMYNDLVAALSASGMDVSSLTKGDETTIYRSADDVIKLANWLKEQQATASGTTVLRTVAYPIRDTV